ncbi:MAG: glycosyltransferase family A protein [Crocinitomicaceae bacterium]|nr:glycosyltransferase family A protein [Crocinitomicaceae bacterium]
MISILLPFRNAARWIQETVQSIQEQSYADWELIAVDDFSTDSSNSILEELAKKDARIQIHSNTEKGIIPALQVGLSKANGEFLTRMDADDIMPEDRLQIMVDRLKSLPAKSIVTGKVKHFSNKPVSDGYLNYDAWLNKRVEKEDYFDHMYRECVVASPNWLARTDDIKNSAIFEKLEYPEDYDMTFHWMQNGFTIQGVNETTLLWREHPHRTSKNSDIYNQKALFQLKLNWFCKLHNTDSLAVLGAGTKGKITAEFLSKRNIDFGWYDLEWKKYGAPIFNKEIQDFELLVGAKLLIAIYPKNKKPLLDFLTEKGFEIGRNAWFL